MKYKLVPVFIFLTFSISFAAAPTIQDIAQSNTDRRTGTFLHEGGECNLVVMLPTNYSEGNPNASVQYSVEFLSLPNPPALGGYEHLWVHGQPFNERNEFWSLDETLPILYYREPESAYYYALNVFFHYDPKTLLIDRIEFPDINEICALN